MRHRPQQSRRPHAGDAIRLVPSPPPDDLPPSSSPQAIAIRQPGETRDEAALRAAREIARLTGKTRNAVPRGPYAEAEIIDLRPRLTAEGQLRAWERSGAECVWQGSEGIEAGKWSARLTDAVMIRSGNALSPRAIRLVSAWLEREGDAPMLRAA
jgi:hypothetical protein